MFPEMFSLMSETCPRSARQLKAISKAPKSSKSFSNVQENYLDSVDHPSARTREGLSNCETFSKVSKSHPFSNWTFNRWILKAPTFLETFSPLLRWVTLLQWNMRKNNCQKTPKFSETFSSVFEELPTSSKTFSSSMGARNMGKLRPYLLRPHQPKTANYPQRIHLFMTIETRPKKGHHNQTLMHQVVLSTPRCLDHCLSKLMA